MRKLLLFLALLLAIPTPGLARPMMAVVVFEVDLGEGGAIRDLKVAKITAPNGQRPPREIPQASLAAAREHFTKLYKGHEPGHFFTYLLFDPERGRFLGVDAQPTPERGGAERP
jgi:hypothetical protein